MHGAEILLPALSREMPYCGILSNGIIIEAEVSIRQTAASYADYAIALADEAMGGSHIRERISVVRK